MAIARLSRSIAKRGVLGTLALAIQKAERAATWWMPSQRRARREELEFDRRAGVDTAGRVTFTDLDAARARLGGGEAAASLAGFNGYQATSPAVFSEIMDALAIDCERFTFVDIGSGKGRVLLLASERPFRRVIGVEISRELHECAESNIARFRSAAQRCRDVRSVCADASAWPLPAGPLVLYLYNPCDGEILDRILDNIQGAIERPASEVVVVYVPPCEGRLLPERDWLERVRAVGRSTIYRAAPRAGAVASRKGT